jgi:hypothetical protein
MENADTMALLKAFFIIFWNLENHGQKSIIFLAEREIVQATRRIEQWLRIRRMLRLTPLLLLLPLLLLR